jgi:hypothetical protein
MEEQTITEEPIVESGAQDALPESQSVDTAVETTSESTDNESSEGAEALPEVDEKLQSFAKGQGIENVAELSEREQKLLKVAYDNNAGYQRNRQKASELEKGLTQRVDEEAEYQGLQDDDRIVLHKMAVKQAVRDFWDENPEAKNHEKQMIEVLADNPHLAGDLEALYGKALLRSGASDTLKSEGGREALNRLANKQRAASPQGSAVNSAIPSNKITRDVIREKTQAGDVAWLDKNQTEINRLVSEGLLN